MVRRLYFLEPSKVGIQHISVIEGYLRALAGSERIVREFELHLLASRSTLRAVSADVLDKYVCSKVPVMNPEKRRLMRKSIVELGVLLRCLFKLQRKDLLFVSCLLPTTLLMLEVINRVLRIKGVYVVLHGEIEGLFAGRAQKWSSIGYWAWLWLQCRPRNSLVSLVVLDDFIKRTLLESFGNRLDSSRLHVVYLPIIEVQWVADRPQTPQVVFIGYRTGRKSFEDFCALSVGRKGMRFVAIGGGRLQYLQGEEVALTSKAAYLESIATCTIAVFPYKWGYHASLSASAMDALIAGVPILALRQPCFTSLEDYFGSDLVAVFDSIEEMGGYLDRLDDAKVWSTRSDRLHAVANSKYNLNSVGLAFERMILPQVS